MDEDMTLAVEYKFFEPGFYTTDLMDWGMSYMMCNKLGDQAKVLVDVGHHSQGANIEHIVSILLDEAVDRGKTMVSTPAVVFNKPSKKSNPD